jgi:hypothetical protein
MRDLAEAIILAEDIGSGAAPPVPEMDADVGATLASPAF